MNNNHLVWSCNRKKLAKVLAVSGMEKYKERLGRKLNTEWFIQVQYYRDYTGINQFSPSSRTDRPYNVELQFSLLSSEGPSEHTEIEYKLLTSTILRISGKLYFSPGDKAPNDIGNYVLKNPNDCSMDLIFTFPRATNPKNIPEYPATVSMDCGLKDDLVSLLTKERFSDVTLKCKSEILKAHKSILSARSPVFETMFNSPMQESEAGMVVIKDLSPDAFRSMMYFVYGGEVQITSLTSACDLLYAAEKYQLKGLKKVCLDYLKSILATENSIQVLEIVDLYDSKLKCHVISFIKEHFEDLECTKDWRELKQRKPVLALEVYSTGE